MNSPSRIVVTGALGQLGQRLVALIQSSLAFEAIGVDLLDFDITHADRTRKFLIEKKPQWVINCAAMTHVDGCETRPIEALAVNAGAVRTLATVCDEIDATLLQISTDYVFSGQSGEPYKEEDDVGPNGVYAQTKYKGEQYARSCHNHLVVRTAWLYGAAQGNFVTAILDRARAGMSLRVVTDEVGSPSYAPDVAEGLLKLVEVNARGTYHLVNKGQVSRFELAKRIIELAGIDTEIEPVTALEYGAAAPRPRFGVLDCGKYESTTKHKLRDWQSALEEFVLADRE